jgi:hypothetical protein
MKKIFILFVIIFLSLSFVQSKADCPPGWTSHNFTYLYDTDGDGRGQQTAMVWIVIIISDLNFKLAHAFACAYPYKNQEA